MSTFDTLLATETTSALDALAGFDRRAALHAGIKPSRIDEWDKLHHTYYGPTAWTAQQRHALELAREGEMSLDQLALIEKHLGAVKNPREKWELRHELLGMRGKFETLRREAKALISAEKKPSKKQARFSPSRCGMRTMSLTADEQSIADLEHVLMQGIDPSKPAAPQMADNFLRRMRRGGGGIPTAAARPMLLVPPPAYARILRGEGDDIVLGLTNATTTTGAEFLREHLSDELEIALIHPQEGPVNLYRAQRLANQKQRDLIRAATPVCPVPGCRHGADNCEIHHITPWKYGGETNLDNLAPLCRYHNRVNDDDPWRNKRGRIERIRGAPVWRSPSGKVIQNDYHRFGAAETLFGTSARA